jgi:hypothetical protein
MHFFGAYQSQQISMNPGIANKTKTKKTLYYGYNTATLRKYRLKDTFVLITPWILDTSQVK